MAQSTVESGSGVSTLLRSLLDPQGLADPYPVYESLRRMDAECRAARVVVGHAESRAVLVDRRMSADRAPALAARLTDDVRNETQAVTDTLRAIIAFRDPPGHTRLRRLMTVALSSRAVAHRRQVIERLTDQRLEEIERQLAAKGDGLHEFDIVAALTFPLPAMVVAAILGIPEQDRQRFVSWANDIVMYVGSGAADEETARRTARSINEMQTFMRSLVQQRRAAPQDDLLTAMIEAEDDGRLTDDEIHANALFLMTAGHETATNMLSNGLLTLLRHPEVADALRREPERIDAAVEELLRFESPVQMTARMASEDAEVAGIQVAAGESILVVLGAANRDPAVFERPAAFDIDRTELGHVAFGHGPHWCIGGGLAREEARIVLPMVLDRFPDLQLATSDVEWQPTLNFRGPIRLPVRAAGASMPAAEGSE